MKYLHFHLIFNLLLLFINIITIICCCFFQVQCIEPKFYLEFLKGMGLENAKGLPHQHDRESWPWMEARFSSIFLTKTRDEVLLKQMVVMVNLVVIIVDLIVVIVVGVVEVDLRFGPMLLHLVVVCKLRVA